MEVQILYQDKDILICSKPAGVPSQKDLSGQKDLLTHLSESYHGVSLVHRLDTPTGGVMVFGLNPKSTAKLCSLVQDHALFQKEYIAVLSKSPSEKSGELRDFLYHDKRSNKSFVTDGGRKGCKEAVLEYRVISEDEEGHALVTVWLHTGRTHQIRVQFASRGMPLAGDGKYGSREKCPYIALWAHRLTFPHPVKKNSVSASSKPDTSSVPWSFFSDVIDRM